MDELGGKGRSEETIYALASGEGRAAVAVLRLSGANVRNIVVALAGKQPEPRRATLAGFRDPRSGEMIDKGLLLLFPAPHSFTGEDYAEFHVHGSRAVLAAFLDALSGFSQTRLAESGEFTRRAFENGKLDLTEVEGLVDLIDAETEAQRRQALRQAQGGLRQKAETWRGVFLEASALIEGEIDFAEEIDGSVRSRISALLIPLLADLEAVLAEARAGERLRNGLSLAIMGPPNAGKSTLLNALARREAAIVSPVPGTTRDAIEVHLDVAGYPVTLIDTAGLRESEDPVERIGVERARARAETADLVLWLSEATGPVPPPDFAATLEVWPIATKVDLLPETAAARPELRVSAATGENLDLLIGRLADFARKTTGSGESALITQARQRKAIQAAAAALRGAVHGIDGPAELLAEDLRAAIRALEMLVGRIDVETVLGEIFARFCIGK